MIKDDLFYMKKALSRAKEAAKHGEVLPNRYPYYLDFMPNIDSVVIFKNDDKGAAREDFCAAP